MNRPTTLARALSIAALAVTGIAADGMSHAVLAQSGAAAAGSQRQITFSDAVQIALRQNITLKQAENARELSGMSVEQQRNQLFPSLSFSTGTSQNFGRTFNQTEGRIVDRSTQSLSAGLSSNVTLFNGFQNTSLLKQARFSENASVSELERSRQTIVFTVAANFLSLVTLQEQSVVQQQSLAAQQALAEQIQLMVDNGVRSIADLYQQQAAVASARSTIVGATRAVELAKVDLIQTLQLDAAQSYEFVAPVFDTSGTDAAFVLEELLATAFADRADLNAEQSRVDAADQARSTAGASRWPSANLSMGYNSNYSSATDASIGQQFGDRRSGSLGLSFSIPLFDRGASSIAVQQATIQAANARLAYERQKQTVSLEVRRAFLDYQSALDQLVATTAQLRAADLALSMTEERYRVGVSNLVELTQSRAAQVAAASALVNARYNLVFQRALMTYYTGELQPTNVTF